MHGTDFKRICRYAAFALSAALAAISLPLMFHNAGRYQVNLLWAIPAICFPYAALILSMARAQKYKAMWEALNSAAKDIEAANTELKAFKHDLSNHLQVISSLIQMQKYDSAKNYLAALGTGTSVSRKESPHSAVGALLAAKRDEAARRGISFTPEVFSSLSSLRGIPGHDLTRILGNIIDNAIYAETASSSADRTINVKVTEESDKYIFSVYNKSSYISSSTLSRLFEPGFSTKGSRGQGLGLYTVRSLLKKHGGDIQISSEPEKGTCFTVSIPKADLSA